MNGNGVAALRPWPVIVDLGGKTYRIAPYPAIRWIIPIIDDDWFAVIPGLLDPSDHSVDDALDSGAIRHEDCVREARNAVSVVAGVQWWSAVALVQSALAAPDVMGELTLRGVDPLTVSLGAFVFATYRVFTRDADKKQRAKIDHDLAKPPPGLTLAERSGMDAGSSGFEEMMRQRAGRS